MAKRIMNIYMLTSNNWQHVAELNSHFINKYWPDQKINIVGFEKINNIKNIESNVRLINLGVQEKIGSLKQWSKYLYNFFEKIEDEYFILVFDDSILMKEVNALIFDKLKDEIHRIKPDKVQIGGGINLKKTFEYYSGFLEFDKDVAYRWSLHPAIWKRTYFLKCLKTKQQNPWQFETNTHQYFDNSKIIIHKYDLYKEGHLYQTIDAFRGGKLVLNEDLTWDFSIIRNMPMEKFYKVEDLRVIYEKLKNTKAIR